MSARSLISGVESRPCPDCGLMKPPDCWKCPAIVRAQAQGRAIRERASASAPLPDVPEQLDLFTEVTA